MVHTRYVNRCLSLCSLNEVGEFCRVMRYKLVCNVSRYCNKNYKKL